MSRPDFELGNVSGAWPYAVGVAIGLVVVVLLILVTPPWGKWS